MADSSPSLRELHCDVDISPVDVSPQPETKRRPRFQLKPKTMEKRKDEPAPDYPIRYPLGYRTGNRHNIIENTDFFIEALTAENMSSRHTCEVKIKEFLNTFADFIEANQQSHLDLELPPFPTKKFWEKVLDIYSECYFRFKLEILSIRVFEALHETVKQLPGCMNVSFSYVSYIPMDFANNTDFYKRCDKKELEEYLETRKAASHN